MEYNKQTKTCPHCKRTLPVKAFPPRHVGENYPGSYCYECNRKRGKKYYKKNKKIWVEWAKNNKDKVAESNRRTWDKLRNGLFDAYGGRCTCCKESHREFLNLEHIKKDGQKERKLLRNNRTVYRKVRDAGYPKDRYTILCWNCNVVERHGKTCPHKLEKRN